MSLIWNLCPTDAETTPSLQRRIDDNVAQRVEEALWSDPFLDPICIQVRVADGVVTLRGVIGDDEQRRRCIMVASELGCVRDVIGLMTLSPCDAVEFVEAVRSATPTFASTAVMLPSTSPTDAGYRGK